MLVRALAALLLSRVAGLYDPIHRLESARLYGNIHHYSYYFVDITVGSPPQRVSVILDTGSGLLAFPCAGCPHCGRHIDPLFDFSQSSTAEWVAANTPECQQGKFRRRSYGADSKHCRYFQSYLEGSSISGYWFHDFVHLGDSIQRNPGVRVKMGCHQNENKLFYTQDANGIFGIQGPTTVLHTLFADHEHVNTSQFSVCLSVEGGALTVGGYNASLHDSPVQYMAQIGSGYGVELTSMSVSGMRLSTPFKRTMIDSGTTYTYFNRQHYRQLRQEIENYCASSRCGATLRGQCWQVQHGTDRFPPIEMLFGNVKVTWWPHEYLYRKSPESQPTSWCYSFQDDGSRTTTTLGASWMQYKDVVFDLGNQRIGVAPARCPEYKKRPEHFSDEARIRPPDAAEFAALQGAPAPLEAAAPAAPRAPARDEAQPERPGSAPSVQPSTNVAGAASQAEALLASAPEAQGGPSAVTAVQSFAESVHTAPPEGAPAEASEGTDNDSGADSDVAPKRGGATLSVLATAVTVLILAALPVVKFFRDRAPFKMSDVPHMPVATSDVHSDPCPDIVGLPHGTSHDNSGISAFELDKIQDDADAVLHAGVRAGSFEDSQSWQKVQRFSS